MPNKASSVQDAVDTLSEQLVDKFSIELLKILKARFASHFLIIFSELYNSRFGELASRMDSQMDPTSPSIIKDEVFSYVMSQVKSAIDEASISNGQLSMGFLSYEDFGYPTGPGKKETDHLKLFYFYMEGVPESYAFISRDFFSKYIAPENEKDLGRFGEGYLMSEKVYNKIADARKGATTLPQLPAFESVKSPASGWPPTRIFEDMGEAVEIMVEQYIKEAGQIAFGD